MSEKSRGQYYNIIGVNRKGAKDVYYSTLDSRIRSLTSQNLLGRYSPVSQ